MKEQFSNISIEEKISYMRYMPGITLDVETYEEELRRDGNIDSYLVVRKTVQGFNDQGRPVKVTQMENENGEGALIVDDLITGERRIEKYRFKDNLIY